MMPHRASTLMAATALALLFPAAAAAQIDDGVVINIMRECAKIDDPTARLACYDNNIRQAGASPRPATPGQVQAPQGTPGAPAAGGRTGFGAESVRGPERFVTPPDQVSEISAAVTRVTPREPGTYLLELEDGAQWLFAQSVDRSYRVPQPGANVQISRASLGSFLMRFDGQVAVRVRRVR